MNYSAQGPSSISSGSSSVSSSSCASEAPFSISTAIEGYDLDFVPAPEARYECPVCLLILREPRQTKCGHRFCRDCILRSIRDPSRPPRCPVDNEPLTENDLFPDNFAKREILNFNVRCSNSKDGCDKIVPLGKLQNHLDMCPLALVPCPLKCTSIVPRCDLDDHLNMYCELRSVSCDLCLNSFTAKLTEEHKSVCPKCVIACPHCGEQTPRDEMEMHIQNSCQEVEVHCSFYYLGCGVTMVRKKENEHLLAEAPLHMKILCQIVTDLIHRKTAESQAHESPPYALAREQSYEASSTFSNSRRYSAASGYPSQTLSSSQGENSLSSSGMTGYLPLLSESPMNIERISQPMDSLNAALTESDSTKGNKNVSPAAAQHGVADGGNLPDYDDGQNRITSTTHSPSLPVSTGCNVNSWNSNNFSPVHYSDPCIDHTMEAQPREHGPRQKLPVRRISANQQHNHDFLRSTTLPEGSQAPHQDKSPRNLAQGPDMLHLLQNLNLQIDEKFASQQLKLDKLAQKCSDLDKTNMEMVNKIKELELKLMDADGHACNGDFYWSIRNFGQYLARAQAGEQTMLHSPPFYTSPWGYKVSLRANVAYGGPSHLGLQHLSLFIHLMQGANDHFLPWPFTGKIILTVIDQNRDHSSCIHVKETLEAKPQLAAFQKPTTARNHKGFGYVEFMSLDMLNSRSYLLNNTLVIRAQVTPNNIGK